MAFTIYMDVHVPRAVTNDLSSRGVQDVTAQEDGTAELDGPPLLDRATKFNCTLYTQDDDLLAEARHRQTEGIHSPSSSTRTNSSAQSVAASKTQWFHFWRKGAKRVLNYCLRADRSFFSSLYSLA